MNRKEAAPERLGRQLAFVREVDKLKKVARQTLLMDGSRYENDAEHSWHLCVMALVLCEHANESVDLLKVLTMVIIHDLVEVYAGDTFCYDEEAYKGKYDREEAAAEKIFGILPDEQRGVFLEAWKEFEEGKTPESRFAAALDRLQPVMHNCATRGAAWRKHGVGREMVETRNSHIRDGSDTLWDEFERMVNEAAENGCFDSD